MTQQKLEQMSLEDILSYINKLEARLPKRHDTIAEDAIYVKEGEKMLVNTFGNSTSYLTPLLEGAQDVDTSVY